MGHWFNWTSSFCASFLTANQLKTTLKNFSLKFHQKHFLGDEKINFLLFSFGAIRAQIELVFTSL